VWTCDTQCDLFLHRVLRSAWRFNGGHTIGLLPGSSSCSELWHNSYDVIFLGRVRAFHGFWAGLVFGVLLLLTLRQWVRDDMYVLFHGILVG
jgi:hypothetical protein